MEQDFVTYEQAKELFDMGLRVPIAIRGYVRQYGEMILTDNVYDGHYALEAPLKSQTFRWFREKFDLFGLVHRLEHMEEYYYMWVIERVCHSSDWETYEEAENACIDKLIELAKESIL